MVLQVKNVERNTTLVNRGRVANNVWTRFIGLIGTRHLDEGDGLAIIPCSGVHCFFMSIPIDVVYVNIDNRVVALDPSLKPWRIGGMHRGVKYVIELPVGTIDRTQTHVGDQLEVSY